MIGKAVFTVAEPARMTRRPVLRATGIIKGLQDVFGRYGTTLSYRRLTGPLLEEFGLLAYPLFIFFYAFGIISAKDFRALTSRVSSLQRLRFVGANTLFLGYRGLPLAIGASLLLVSPFAALVGVILASTFTGVLFISRHEKGHRAPPILISIVSSVAIIEAGSPTSKSGQGLPTPRSTLCISLAQWVVACPNLFATKLSVQASANAIGSLSRCTRFSTLDRCFGVGT